ncbi:TPA_asm: hypothetical protein G4Y38_004352 [Salmonella enterica subsp. enterica serovar Javiana]|nr:hypothetical protein [Salmonella enterica]EAO4192969.1 hypothetical protein [Salmonella enterica]HAE9022031.1 hypothetical protein [Salmonella enterica subsp. enterica serovar Javiana]
MVSSVWFCQQLAMREVLGKFFLTHLGYASVRIGFLFSRGIVSSAVIRRFYRLAQTADRSASPYTYRPPPLTGRVIRVIDGDTVVVLTQPERTVRVRLSGIDAPEKGLPFGQRACQFLASRVAGRVVEIAGGNRDLYDRALRTLWADGRDINEWPGHSVSGMWRKILHTCSARMQPGREKGALVGAIAGSSLAVT